jgi:predicted permease
MSREAAVSRWAQGLYSWLLLLYPGSFQDEYAGEMTAAFADRWAEVRRSGGGLAALRFAAGVATDTLRTAVVEHSQLAARDLRQAWRNLSARRHLPFTLASVATLALGIGGTTFIYALVHALLLVPLPFREADRLVHVGMSNPERGVPDFSVSEPDYLSFQERVRSLRGLAAIQEVGANLSGEGEPERLRGFTVSPNLFSVLGLPLVAGRSFGPADAAPGSADVAILGEGLWRRRFGADRGILGRSIRIDGAPRTVVGIAPQDAGFATDVDLWMPLEILPGARRGNRMLDLLGRLAPGATAAGAQAELETVAERLAAEFPDSNRGWHATTLPVARWIVGRELRNRLFVLLAAVGVLLLAACANVANLQVARAAVRMREVAIRLALGASPGRVVRHLMTENLLLAALGGGAGLALAWAATRGARALLPPTLPRLAGIALDPGVAAFALGLIAVTAFVFGLAPSLLAARGAEVWTALREAGRSGAAGGRAPIREALVVAQLALATLLAIGAALLTHSFVRLQSVPLGFQPQGLLAARLSLPEIRSDDDMRRATALCDALLAQVRSLPGVESVGLTSEVPMGEINTSMEVGAIRTGGRAGGSGAPGAGAPSASGGTSGRSVQAAWRIVGSGYLPTLRVPLRAGRDFAASGEPPSSAMISGGLAKRLFAAGGDPIGREVWLGNGQARTVVGVVGDVRQVGVAKEAPPTIYFSPSWYLWPTMTVAVRTGGDPALLIAPLHQVMKRVAPEVPLFQVRTLKAVVDADIAQPRLQASLVALFAAIGLLLAAVGIAGIVAYSVTQRTPELAVRAALGASPSGIVGHVLRRGLILCASGVGLGVLLAALFGGGLQSLLYGVQARTPAVFATTALALFAVGAAGCWLPARRAAAIAPARALQGE